MDPVYQWKAIESSFSSGLVLGNGSSIAFDRRFAYGSLKGLAVEEGLITADVDKVFRHLDSDDFELVMRMLWHASQINQALEVEDPRTSAAYSSVRDALIAVVQAVHVPYGAVSDRLPLAADFMSRFSTVVSLSYDLLVYWAILSANDERANRFKDCFIRGQFNQDWQWLRQPYRSNWASTLVFYPHGNLALAATLSGAEFKIQVDGGALLETVFDRWREDATPLFVSEGTSEQKRAAIRRSPYLSAVYDEVLPELGESVVTLGWSMGENDDHLLEAICRRGTRRFAVAVDPNSDRLAESQANVRRRISGLLREELGEVVFYDWTSPGCWINLDPAEVDR